MRQFMIRVSENLRGSPLRNATEDGKCFDQCGLLLLAATHFACRFALHFDSAGLVQQPAGNADDQGRNTDLLVPPDHRALVGQAHRSLLVAVPADFQEVPALGVGRPLASADDLHRHYRSSYPHRRSDRTFRYAVVALVETLF